RTKERQREQYEAEFAEGEYVIYLDVHRQRDKLQARKGGPMLVVAAISPWVYRLRNIATGAEVEAHVQRMEHYADANLGVTEALKEHVRYATAGYEVAAITEARRAKDGRWELLVKWLGSNDEEATWV